MYTQEWNLVKVTNDLRNYQTRVAVPSYPTSSAGRECSVIHVPRALAADNFGYSHPSEYKAVWILFPCWLINVL